MSFKDLTKRAAAAVYSKPEATAKADAKKPSDAKPAPKAEAAKKSPKKA